MPTKIQILEIYAPSSAHAGDTLNVSINIKNITSSEVVTVAGTGTIDSTNLTIQPSYILIQGGGSGPLYCTFTMPNKNTIMTVYAWYWDGSKWVLDSQKQATILLSTYKGTITSVVIRKDSSDLSVPASLKVNDSCELHVFGRNDGIASKMGMKAIISKPDGSSISGQYEMSTQQDSGQTLRFSVINIPVNQSGVWSAYVQYYTLPSGGYMGETLATWSGNIITVPAAYKGTITGVLIRKDSQDLAAPASLKVNDHCELHVLAKLDASSLAVKCGVKAAISKPDGSVITGQNNMSTLQNPGQELRFTVMNILVDQAGTWAASLIEYYTII